MRRTMARHVILVAAVVSLASGLPYATTGVSAQDGAGTESGEDPNAGVGDVGDALGGGSGDGSGEAAEGTTGEGEATDMGEGASDDAAPVGGTEGETEQSAERDEPMDAGTYAVRLRDLEQRINELKEQIFRSKARLSLLAETVLQGVVAGAQAIVVHENRMSSSYKLVKAVYALDGAPIFNKADEEGSLSDREEFQVYNGSIVPGEHTLTVNLEYRGHGYGIFSYLKGYRFKVRSNYSFTAPEGRAVTVRVVGYEKGGPTAPLEERPAIRYIERVQDRAAARREQQAEEEEEE
ncbi:MAG TPA: hypothetical protein RMH85_25100 [Polyangiaceae bacterium LLY-WYZ-15_(1-7)]|nr:hypothetical protein [Polyangiaceae bacterium LLY-WYZ-15_(1-7)]HJL06173.1 hypothetical protein [Polyangiaceae bacterium LLY-WYZ-15_(1-7)]HJL11778.1 hypothetical protein [Polyangiaceae bacterium LLY-WYZ-15_(1-7)]HJL22097.1 hypothetical protein [Polyangiaceae bacterium LLY-WYZ-15_(1-7)]HJL34437.1 hypothetical protein [Polyangiaceae bacterium LLY-WYZ-15_(1-7)]